MACTCKTIYNKNAIGRLHPVMDDSTPDKPKYLIYIRGNKTNPLGILDKLMYFGGHSGNYTTADLMTSNNLFYIDYKNNNIITFEPDNTMMAEAIKGCWEEMFPGTNLSHKPEDWEGAVIDYPAAALYDEGKDEETNNQIKIVGKLKVLRDIYRKGWIPQQGEPLYYIAYRADNLDSAKSTSWSRFLSFQSAEIRDEFLTNYRDMIESVKTYI
ncbi:MAG: hypothetical protein J6D03_00615 [Clostridia bacterium]|nr:hypothetical protein [Clostridia bacterium]